MEKEKELLRIMAVERSKMLTAIKAVESVSEDSKEDYYVAIASKINEIKSSVEEIKKAINNYLNK